jgi:hypothetical protein
LMQSLESFIVSADKVPTTKIFPPIRTVEMVSWGFHRHSA